MTAPECMPEVRDELVTLLDNGEAIWMDSGLSEFKVVEVERVRAALAAHDRLIEADVGERIAAAIHDAKPPHMTRDYTPVDAAYDNCARIARAVATGGEGGQ